MPWDGTELMVARLGEDGALLAGSSRCVCGGRDEAVQQPQWSSDGRHLYLISDRSGWWNVYRCTPSCTPGAQLQQQQQQQVLVPLCPMPADFGFPPWTFGLTTYSVLSSGAILTLFSDPSSPGLNLGLIDPPPPSPEAAGAHIQVINSGCTHFGSPACIQVQEGQQDAGGGGVLEVLLVGSSPTANPYVRLLRYVRAPSCTE